MKNYDTQIQVVTDFKLFGTGQLDDFSDRLSYKFSCFILFFVALVILLKQYFMNAVSCYTATNLGGTDLVAYLESYCWVNGVVPLSFNVTLPDANNQWKSVEKLRIIYYQWIPFVLLFQGIMCYIPHIIWSLFNSYGANKDYQHLFVMAQNANNKDKDKRQNEIIRLAQTLEHVLFRNRTEESKSLVKKNFQKSKSFMNMWNEMGIPLMLFYIFIKTSYVVNAIGQIFLMQSFLSIDSQKHRFFGASILNDLFLGQDWQATLTFPRVGYCFAKIRQLGATNYVTSQCVLPINMFSEKIYIFLWFWMFFLSIVCSTSLVVWSLSSCIRKSKAKFLKKYLQLSGDYTNEDLPDNKVLGFESYFLQNNGMFFLKMLANNAGELITADVVSQLWKIYLPKYCEMKRLDLEKLENCIFEVKGWHRDDRNKRKSI